MKSLLSTLLSVGLFCIALTASGQIRFFEKFDPCGAFEGEARVFERTFPYEQKAYDFIWVKFPPPCHDDATATWVEGGQFMGRISIGAVAEQVYDGKIIAGQAGVEFQYELDDAFADGQASGVLPGLDFEVTQPVRVNIKLTAYADSDRRAVDCYTHARAEATFSAEGKSPLRTWSEFEVGFTIGTPPIDEDIVLCPGARYTLSARGRAIVGGGGRCGYEATGWGQASFQLEILETLDQCR